MTIDERLDNLTHSVELMQGMMQDLIVKFDGFIEQSAKRDEEYLKRDAEYHKLRQRVLRGALGLLGVDESEGE